MGLLVGSDPTGKGEKPRMQIEDGGAHWSIRLENVFCVSVVLI